MNNNIVNIKSLPIYERPREKLIYKGVNTLSNVELLAILIGSGDKYESAITLAERLISSDSRGIRFFADCTPEELCKVNGIGPAKASVIMAAVELGKRIMTTRESSKINVRSPEDVASIFMEQMRYLKKEHFKVLLLNTKSEMIAVDHVSVGSLQTAEAHPREVFSMALRRSASGVILVHNHPSGNPKPSQADIYLTARLVKSGEILGIKVLDHIVIGDGIFISMKSEGLF